MEDERQPWHRCPGEKPPPAEPGSGYGTLLLFATLFSLPFAVGLLALALGGLKHENPLGDLAYVFLIGSGPLLLVALTAFALIVFAFIRMRRFRIGGVFPLAYLIIIVFYWLGVYRVASTWGPGP